MLRMYLFDDKTDADEKKKEGWRFFSLNRRQTKLKRSADFRTLGTGHYICGTVAGMMSYTIAFLTSKLTGDLIL